MALVSGTRLGPYEILALIGAGGMGEVYRGRDTRLHREVAIKISAQQFSVRFEREARAIASLNHTNVCHLYDVGPNYLVMELVEGETLSGPLKLEEAMPIIRQLIDGIEAAHEKKIVHRDLKPANIKTTPDGVVKILDFGLAKATAPEPGNPQNSATLTMGATVAGTILGTPAYMAPEQARGNTADRRSDIWSFGVVVYELLTGKRAFEGASAVEILGAVINREPDWTLVPPRAQRLVKWCLEKDRKQRLQSIGDARRMLEEAPESPPAPPSMSWFGVVTAITAIAMTVIAAVASWGWWRSSRSVERPLIRLDVDLGPDVSLPAHDIGGRSSVIISPDGRRLVYVASTPGRPVRLFTRRLDQPKATELTSTDGAVGPFFSPDGQWVGFIAGNKYNKISVEGGAVVPWSEDSGIILGNPLKGLLRIPPGGGAAAPVTEVATGEFMHLFPQILPGGKAVLFASYKTPAAHSATVEVVSLADRRRKALIPGGTSPRYVPSGHLMYANGATLFAIPFDLDRLETRGAAVPVLDDLATAAKIGSVEYDVSQTGTLVYRRRTGGTASGMMTVQWLDAAGKKEPLAAKQGRYNELSLSPDGKRLAVSVSDGASQDIWVYEWQRDAWTKLTFGGGDYIYPVWSPDGRYVVFGFLSGGMFWARADGSGQPQSLTQSKDILYSSFSFTPDGKRLAYVVTDSSAGLWHIWTAPVEDDGGQLKAGKPEQFLKTQFTDTYPVFSPDGRWLAYGSTESGRFEVYVRAFPPPVSGQGGRSVISTNGGAHPVWSRANHELLYQAGDQIMAVSYTVKGDSFVADKPRVWAAKFGGTEWDLAPDGKRLAVLTPVDSPEPPKTDHEVVFLLNFFDELRRRAPAGK